MPYEFTPNDQAKIADLIEMLDEDWREQFDQPLPKCSPSLALFLVRGVETVDGFGPEGSVIFSDAAWPQYFITRFDANFHWEYGMPYVYGDHPDTGGGARLRDVVDAILDSAAGLSRRTWVALIGRDAVAEIESYALHNLEPEE